jgi:hypothetical protein
MLLSSKGFKYFLPGKADQPLAKYDVGCEAEKGCGRTKFVHGEISGYDCRVAQGEKYQLVSLKAQIWILNLHMKFTKARIGQSRTALCVSYSSHIFLLTSTMIQTKTFFSVVPSANPVSRLPTPSILSLLECSHNHIIYPRVGSCPFSGAVSSYLHLSSSSYIGFGVRPRNNVACLTKLGEILATFLVSFGLLRVMPHCLFVWT